MTPLERRMADAASFYQAFYLASVRRGWPADIIVWAELLRTDLGPDCQMCAVTRALRGALTVHHPGLADQIRLPPPPGMFYAVGHGPLAEGHGAELGVLVVPLAIPASDEGLPSVEAPKTSPRPTPRFSDN
jgi:hypothetical protein